MSNSGINEFHGKVTALIALVPSLGQLIALAAVAFSDKVDLNELFIKNEIIPLLNIIAFCLSIALIGTVVFLENFQTYIDRKTPSRLRKLFDACVWKKLAEKFEIVEEDDETSRVFERTNKNRSKERKKIVLMFLVSTISSIVFLYTTIQFRTNSIKTAPYAFAQGSSYILFITFLAGVIYCSTKLLNDISVRNKKVDFVENFRKTLIQSGYFKLEIWRNHENDSISKTHLVQCEINGQAYTFIVSEKGDQILNSEPINLSQQQAASAAAPTTDQNQTTTSPPSETGQV